MTDAVEIKRRRPWAVILLVGILGLIGALGAISSIRSNEYLYYPHFWFYAPKLWLSVLRVMLGCLGIASAIGLIKFKEWGPRLAIVYLLGFIIQNIFAMGPELSASTFFFGHLIWIGLCMVGIYSMSTRIWSIWPR